MSLLHSRDAALTESPSNQAKRGNAAEDKKQYADGVVQSTISCLALHFGHVLSRVAVSFVPQVERPFRPDCSTQQLVLVL